MRLGVYDVLVGINLLREGLDIPECGLVAILDADKEGFLRNERSLVQTVGRAARNVNGRVIMYADKITGSMQYTIDETARRRLKQIEYNVKHNITPTQAGKKALLTPMGGLEVNVDGKIIKAYVEAGDEYSIAADPVEKYMTGDELKKQLTKTKSAMLRAAKELDFAEAARLRDEMYKLEGLIKNKN